MPQAEPILTTSRAIPVPEPSRPRLERTNAIVVPSCFHVEKDHNIPLKKTLPMALPKAASPSDSPKSKKMNPTTPAGRSAIPNSSVARKPVPDKAETPQDKIELKAKAPFVYVKKEDTESPELFPPLGEIELGEIIQPPSAHVQRQEIKPLVHRLYAAESSSSSDESTFEEIKLDEAFQPLVPARTANRQDTRPYVHRLYCDDRDLEDGHPIPMEPGRVWHSRNDPERDTMNRDTDVNQGPSPLKPRYHRGKGFKGLLKRKWFIFSVFLFVAMVILFSVLATRIHGKSVQGTDKSTQTMAPRQLGSTPAIPIYTTQPENHPHDTGYQLECLATSCQDCWDMNHTFCSSDRTIMNSPPVSLMGGNCTSNHCICTPFVKPRAAQAPTAIATVPPGTGTISPAAFAANVAEAAAYNKLFATLNFSSVCNVGGIACIDGNVGHCEDTGEFGGAFVMSVCAKGTGCLVAPMNTTRGVFIGCMGTPDAQASGTLATSSAVQETTASSFLTTTTSLVRATTTTITLTPSSLPSSCIPTITNFPSETTTQTSTEEASMPATTPAPTPPAPAPGTYTEPSTPPHPGWVSILTTVSGYSFEGETIPPLTFPEFTFPGTYLPATTVPPQTISGWFAPPKYN